MRLIIQGKTDFQRNLPVFDTTAVDVSTCLDDLEPAHVAYMEIKNVDSFLRYFEKMTKMRVTPPADHLGSIHAGTGVFLRPDLCSDRLIIARPAGP